MRKPLIAGNWKMNGDTRKVSELIQAFKQAETSYLHIDMLICPPAIYLREACDLLSSSSISVGAQNLYPGISGAFTGEISASMIKDIGCNYVLIGHSERRTIFKENLPMILLKCESAIKEGLTPILCVGETLEQRENDQTEEVIREQVESVTSVLSEELLAKLVIAYEPVWAIGTGLTATPEQAQAVHLFIRQLIAKNKVDLAAKLRILYGGSMKPDNAASLLAMPDIDGGLIGGASLDATSFLSICDAAEAERF